jgi:hypothetical protein
MGQKNQPEIEVSMKQNSKKRFSALLCGSILMMMSACGGSSGGSYPEVEQVAYTADPQAISAAWANDGGDKVAQEEIRGVKGPISNGVWNNSKINLFGARNEVIGFNVVLEAANGTVPNVHVEFDHLDGPGSKISTTAATGDGVFDYTKRDIELFFVRYLKIQGLSKLGYEQYDERHIPSRLRRSYAANGAGSGSWTDRPDHDKSYPDIAVPMEAVKSFPIAGGKSQSVWSDIYIPKDVMAGTYQGAIKVYEGDHLSYTLPVTLGVRKFTLPDVPSSKTMLNLGTGDIAKRYVGNESPSSSADIAKVRLIRDRHFQMAHRHKISLIDNNSGTDGSDAPAGYRGPGQDTGNGVFSVGTYGSWSWQSDGKAAIQSHADNWASWFAANSPSTEYFLYLIDESSNYTQIQSWATDLNSNTKVGRNLASMATMPLPSAVTNTPALQVVTSTMDVGDTATWDSALANFKANGGKRFYMYNGKRPASGSFMVDDDGTSLREVPWGQYKKGVDRWFYWESTYYKDFQSGRGQTDVFNQAQTFGATSSYDSVLGQTSGNYANGDGVMFYPGTDTVFPASNYGLAGPIASMRLKEWRRGIQDVDYVTLAAKIDPVRTQAIVNAMVRSVLWENGVTDKSDPTWVRCDIGWSSDPTTWEAARAQLADIIDSGSTAIFL